MSSRPLVVDASVAVKWVLPEVHSAAAHQLLERPCAFLAPDLLWPEVGSSLWGLVQRRPLSPAEAQETLRELLRYPIRVVPSAPLIGSALALALQSKRTVFDAPYCALAVAEGCHCVTADGKLHRSLRNTAIGEYLLWGEDTA